MWRVSDVLHRCSGEVNCGVCRWYTGGPAGGSGQEVIAPGQGGDKKNETFEALREAVEPHAREGTSEDLAEESNVFTGAARTLDGAPPLSSTLHALLSLLSPFR